MSHASEDTEKYTQIARVGTFNDSQGRPHTFTEKDLNSIAVNYNSTNTQAPLVIGHVSSDSAPAYGWVKGLKSENGKLFASFTCVAEEIENLVHKGLYKNVSMSVDVFKKRLIHIALLGAAAPAIDGLGQISFNSNVANDIETIAIDFSSEQGEKLLTSEEHMPVEELKKQLAESQKQVQEKVAEVTRLEASNETLQKDVDSSKAEFSAYKEKQNDENRKARVDKLVADGKLEPAKKDEVLAFASQLAKTPANFSTGGESISMEEKYLRDFEIRETAGVFADFSHTPAHAQTPSSKNNNPDMTASKL